MIGDTSDHRGFPWFRQCINRCDNQQVGTLERPRALQELGVLETSIDSHTVIHVNEILSWTFKTSDPHVPSILAWLIYTPSRLHRLCTVSPLLYSKRGLKAMVLHDASREGGLFLLRSPSQWSLMWIVK